MAKIATEVRRAFNLAKLQLAYEPRPSAQEIFGLIREIVGTPVSEEKIREYIRAPKAEAFDNRKNHELYGRLPDYATSRPNLSPPRAIDSCTDLQAEWGLTLDEIRREIKRSKRVKIPNEILRGLIDNINRNYENSGQPIGISEDGRYFYQRPSSPFFSYR